MYIAVGLLLGVQYSQMNTEKQITEKSVNESLKIKCTQCARGIFNVDDILGRGFCIRVFKTCRPTHVHLNVLANQTVTVIHIGI